MNYWQGMMNWPLEKSWVCETCGENAGLTWGLVHANCRCNKCYTQYMMRDADRNVVTVPICLLREEYKEPARKAWEALNIPMDQLTDAQWERFGADLSKE